IDAKKIGLAIPGKGIACAVGDYDNDGLPDVAVALEGRIAILRNLGHGKFADTTSAVGIRSLNHPAGLTFVDFDHDGDLDLFITGSATTSGMGHSRPDFMEKREGKHFERVTLPISDLTGAWGDGNSASRWQAIVVIEDSPLKGSFALVLKDRGGCAVTGHNQILCPVIVDVGEGGAHAFHGTCKTGRTGPFGECGIAVVTPEHIQCPHVLQPHPSSHLC
ncbi:MAG TPA: VCBS repeat-containing protein, partial [Edaphobacter sp.]|nr:VCBS repeat-containing protein [Edaphobacter sp.]